MEKLTIQEEDVMLRIWEKSSCFVRDVLATYDDPKPPYTTLASVFKNLERKRYIKGKHVGHIYNYSPLIDEAEYKSTFMQGFVSDYFANSYKEMVSFFAKEKNISADELKDIIDMIEKEKE